jgi:hypothetical protein
LKRDFIIFIYFLAFNHIKYGHTIFIFLTYFTNHNLKRTEKKRLVVKTIVLTKINKKYIDTKKIIFIKIKIENDLICRFNNNNKKILEN